MKPGGLPTVVEHKSRTTQKPKLSLAARVANNSQKKIDTLTRIDDVTLKSMYRFYDLEMIICETGFKKNSCMLKKQISSYQKSLHASKTQRQKTAGKTFITQPSPSPDKLDLVLKHTNIEEKPVKPKYGAFLNCEPEAIGSVRRKTKTLLTSSVGKSMADLHRLRDKHICEYKEAVAELHRLQSRLDLPFTFNVSCRSYTPFTAPSQYSPIIISLRNKIKYSENELSKLQRRLNELSHRYERARTTVPAPSTVDDEQDEEKNEPTFKLFCDKKGEREDSNLTTRPITTNLPQLRERRNSRTVKFDLDKLKSEGSISQPMLNLLMSNSRNSHIEIVDNPFGSGELPEQTRSRLLIESKKDDKLYKWLGFKTNTQLAAAIKDNPSSIQQIPAALLTLIEDEEGEVNLDNEEFSDSDAGDDEDEEDLRFKVFDERKFKKKRRTSVLPSQ